MDTSLMKRVDVEMDPLKLIINSVTMGKVDFQIPNDGKYNLMVQSSQGQFIRAKNISGKKFFCELDNKTLRLKKIDNFFAGDTRSRHQSNLS